MPDQVSSLMNETCNWFAHSSKRRDEYVQYYKTMHGGKAPHKLVSQSKSRWLVWVPCSDIILDQWFELRGFFTVNGEGAKGESKARENATLYNSTNKLYLLAMRNILRGVQKVSKSFEKTNADVTKLYSDLRSQVLVLAGRILKLQSIALVARPGMLRKEEVRMLKKALGDKHNYLPVDRISLGDSFSKLAIEERIPAADLNQIQHICGQYIFTLCNNLLDKLPSNLDGVDKLRHLTPRNALLRSARPTFQQLPMDMAVEAVNRDTLESQWNLLGTLTFPEIIDDLGPRTTVDDIDIVRFWGCLLGMKNAGGDYAFRELAEFVLMVLTLPISNAVVERVFSVLSCIKCRRRNKLQLRMLESLIRLRVHLKVYGLCCVKFQPSKAMYTRFTSDMYKRHSADDGQPQTAALQFEVAEDNPDDPERTEEVDAAEQVVGILQNIDYDINELDTEFFNEDLMVVRLGTD